MRVWMPLSSAVALCVAYMLGRVLTSASGAHVPLRVVDDPRPQSATVVLHSWSNGTLRGVMRGSGRIVIGNRAVTVNGSGAFALPLDLPRTAPAASAAYGGGFVASSRGKKYYPAGSPAAAKLSPKNIIHFATRAEAEAAGYTAP